MRDIAHAGMRTGTMAIMVMSTIAPVPMMGIATAMIMAERSR